MGLFKKRVSIEECSLMLAKLCAQFVSLAYECFSTDNQYNLYDTDPEKLYVELWILARFSVDYAVTHELGEANPKRNAILDTCTYFMVDGAEDTNLPDDFLGQLNTNLIIYAAAINRLPDGADIARGTENIGNTFAKMLGLNKKHIMATAGANYFGKILSEVIDIIRSVKVEF